MGGALIETVALPAQLPWRPGRVGTSPLQLIPAVLASIAKTAHRRQKPTSARRRAGGIYSPLVLRLGPPQRLGTARTHRRGDIPTHDALKRAFVTDATYAKREGGRHTSGADPPSGKRAARRV